MAPSDRATRSSRPTRTPAAATRSTASSSRRSTSTTSTRGAASTRTRSRTSATTGATATGTTRCATASRTPTASSARSSSRTPCRRSSPSFVLFAPPPKPEDYEHRLAGIRAHNRWLEDFCGQYPERRAGIGQIFVNDIDDAIEDVKWIKEHDLRGGVLLPPVPPDATWLKPLNHPDYDRLWAVCEDLEVPVNCHGGIGGPEYLRAPVVGAHPDRRARPLLAPAADLHDAVRRVRALPEPEVRA